MATRRSIVLRRVLSHSKGQRMLIKLHVRGSGLSVNPIRDTTFHTQEHLKRVQSKEMPQAKVVIYGHLN